MVAAILLHLTGPSPPRCTGATALDSKDADKEIDAARGARDDGSRKKRSSAFLTALTYRYRCGEGPKGALARTSPRGRCSATKATTPGEPRGGSPARHLLRHPVPRECRRETGFLHQNPLQRTRPRRAGRRQNQTLQAHRFALRENGAELRRLHLARLYLYLGEIRPHDLSHF